MVQGQALPHGGSERWASTWERALPALAVAGPATWFAAALCNAAGIETLDGELGWISRPEGFLMVLGVPFFVATFVVLGQVVARRSPRAGIVVTALGLLGIAPAAILSGTRLLMGNFVDAGLDPKVLNDAFEAVTWWDAGFLLYNLGWFVAWLVAGTVILKTGVAPRWTGACFIGGPIAIVAAQALYIATTVLWPLGTGLLALGLVGLTRGTARGSG